MGQYARRCGHLCDRELNERVQSGGRLTSAGCHIFGFKYADRLVRLLFSELVC